MGLRHFQELIMNDGILAIGRCIVGTGLIVGVIGVSTGSQSTLAQDFRSSFKLEGFADIRVVLADDQVSNLDGGFGKLRYGNDDNKFKIGEVGLVGSGRIAPEWLVVAHAQFNPDLEKQFEIIEAFVQYRPVATSRWRPSLRIGALIPEVSAENFGLGWKNIYTLSNSAANTWIAEEVRPIGAELNVEWRGEDVIFHFGGTAFVGNDFSTEGLSLRGFTFGDQDIGLFGGIRIPDLAGGRINVVRDTFREEDDRLGFAVHSGFESERFGTFNLYYSDNRGDTSVTGSRGRVWNSQFFNVSYNIILDNGFELAAQALLGGGFTTPTDMDTVTLGTDFETVSLLLSKNIGDLVLSLRGEYFNQNDTSACPCPNLDEEGKAFTLSGTYRFGHHRFIAEVIYSSSRRDGDFNNQRVDLDEVLTQLVYRFQF